MKRVDDVVGRYSGRLEHWDVNNEMLRNRFYIDTYGSPQIRYDLFTRSRANDANVKLFLNDYGVVAGGEGTLVS